MVATAARFVIDHATLMVAAYAAFVSTSVALIQFRQFRRDRQAVKLSWLVTPHVSGRRELPPHFFVYATNVGRRVVQLKEIGMVSHGKLVSMASDIGVHPRLDEGQPVGIAFGVEGVTDESVRTLYVRDTRDQVWTMAKREYRAFRAEYASALQASQEEARKLQQATDREWLRDATREKE